ncbi:MAG: flagellar basal-body MS-ring/collar protein FliF [Paracoccaceae bacterium]
MDRLLQTWRALDLRRRVILVGAGVLTLVAVLSLAQVATRPAMALLYSGLDPAAAGEVLGALEQMNVASEVRGDAIYIEEGARDRVRLALASQGLPRQGQAGYELLDTISGFSSTSDMFDAAFWRAKEGELARTILASPGVRAARVHIAVPSRRPFARRAAETTASVTVTMAGGALPTAQAQAIRYLVALAVPDLSPDQVAVIDSRAGIVLGPGEDGAGQDTTAAAAEREAKLKAEIEDLIAARVGRDKARVSVSVETDREAERIVETIIEPDSRVTLSSDTEEVSDTASGAAANVTVASNLPDGDAQGGGERQSSRTESRERVNYDYSERLRERSRQPGAIRRISVAVLVDGIAADGPDGEPILQPRPEEELSALRELVRAAVGYDADRGDVVTVESMAFQPDATPGALVETGPVGRFLERNALALIQIALLAVVVLVLALTVLRPLLLARTEDRDRLMSLDGEGETIDLGSGTGALPGPAADPAQTDTAPSDPEKLRQAVADRPDDALAMLKDWLGDAAREEPA